MVVTICKMAVNLQTKFSPLSVIIFLFEKNCPNRPKTARFCPNGSKSFFSFRCLIYTNTMEQE